ncbi:cobalamin-binding protein [Pedosphaera parvula]|nr:cobalamin-binding protein [Pedosphaera parvula]
MKKRVISLLPGATEIVCALGAGDQLVGRSHECDYPESVRALPVCTTARLDANASSKEIDTQVKDLLQQALSIYSVDRDRLIQLRPDVILTQAQCEVCAISLPDVQKAVAEWTGARPEIVSLSPKRVADVWENIREVADVLQIQDAKEILRGLKNRVVSVIEKSCVMKQPPGVACIEWIEPLMAAGNWVPELVELAGGKNLFGEAGKHSPWLQLQELADANPDVIVVLPCGFNLQRTRAEMAVLTQKPEWSKLPAVRKNQVFLTDGNQYFNRPGPRIVESLEIMAEILHPDRFNFGHRGKAWERL